MNFDDLYTGQLVRHVTNIPGRTWVMECTWISSDMAEFKLLDTEEIITLHRTQVMYCWPVFEDE